MPSLSRTVNCQLLTVNCKVKRGFTLIELLVVIAIIGILVAAGTFSYTNAQKKARDSRRKADLKTIQQALEMYFSQNRKYPQNNDLSAIPPSYSDWTTLKTDLVDNGYIQKLPIDPINKFTSGTDPNQEFVYCYVTVGPFQSYTLYANLENNNDPERLTSTVGIFDYKVISP